MIRVLTSIYTCFYKALTELCLSLFHILPLILAARCKVGQGQIISLVLSFELTKLKFSILWIFKGFLISALKSRSNTIIIEFQIEICEEMRYTFFTFLPQICGWMLSSRFIGLSIQATSNFLSIICILICGWHIKLLAYWQQFIVYVTAW